MECIKGLRFINGGAIGGLPQGVNGTGIDQTRGSGAAHGRNDIMRPCQVDALCFRIRPGREADAGCQVINQADIVHGSFE